MEYKIVPINEVVHSRYSEGYSRSYDSETYLELVNSIRSMGLHNPINVTRKNKAGKYLVIDGDHRLSACSEAGIEMIPVYIDPAVDPDNSDYNEKILNYIHNTQRVNMSTYEAASLYRELADDCSSVRIQDVKACMGISQKKALLFNKLTALDSKSAEWLACLGMDSNSAIVDKMLSIKNTDDREDTMRLADSMGIRDSKELLDFLTNVGSVLGSFSDFIRVHFNVRELPYSKIITSFLLLYPTEERMLDAVDKLNTVPVREKIDTAARFIRLLKGIDPLTGELMKNEACPELLDLILQQSFPCDEASINAVIHFRKLFPENPEKRYCIIKDLLDHNRLTEDDLIRLESAIEKFFFSFPAEVQSLFWDGSLQFHDACFRILNILLEKTYDLPTKLEMIEDAARGKPSPEQFETRLAKAIRERDEMIREIALQTDTDPASLKNDEDILRSTGMPEEDIARIIAEKAASKFEKKSKRDNLNVSAECYVTAQDDPGSDDLSDVVDSEHDFLLLADSMAKSQNTDKRIELELLIRGENESICVRDLYLLAEKTCRKCRNERIFDFKTVNYCDGCMLARLIGEVEDSIGEA
ncbi:MAG: ParB N-terminal domain-containing protein [Anaerolineaceae bacterium]|nr:ParB N-terminal domain-containing protein [Anaerolineaceae bacterium]